MYSGDTIRTVKKLYSSLSKKLVLATRNTVIHRTIWSPSNFCGYLGTKMSWKKTWENSLKIVCKCRRILHYIYLNNLHKNVAEKVLERTKPMIIPKNLRNLGNWLTSQLRIHQKRLEPFLNCLSLFSFFVHWKIQIDSQNTRNKKNNLILLNVLYFLLLHSCIYFNYFHPSGLFLLFFIS